MAKGLTISSLVIAVLIFVVFVMDLIRGISFGKPNILMDIVFVICALALIYISWTTLRELR